MMAKVASGHARNAAERASRSPGEKIQMSNRINNWVHRECKFASSDLEFDYGGQDPEDMWEKLLEDAQDLFDTDLPCGDDGVDSELFCVRIGDNEFACEQRVSDALPYYRCQYVEAGENDTCVSFGKELNTEDNSFFIFIPQGDSNPKRQLEEFLEECLDN